MNASLDMLPDDIVEAVIAEELPLGGSLLGWCQDALDGMKSGMDPREIAALHLACPATVWPTEHPDPARKGTTYTLPGRRCPCVCHTRPGTLVPDATKGSP